MIDEAVPRFSGHGSGVIEALFAISRDGVLLLSLDGRCLRINDQAARQTGLGSVGRAIGTRFVDLWPPAEQARVEAAIATSAAGTPTRFDGVCPTPGGRPRRWAVGLALIRADDGTPLALLGTLQDIAFREPSATEKDKLADSVAERVNTEKMGSWSLDLKNGHFSTSAACRSNFGRDPALPFGYDDLIAAVLPEDEPARQGAVERTLATGEDLDISYRILTPAGGLRAIEIHGQLIADADGTPQRLQGISLDVTARALSDRRREALIELSDRFRDAGDSASLAYVAAEILGRTLGVSRAGYGTINIKAETIAIEIDWNAPGVASIAGTLHFRDYGSYIDDLKSGRTAVVVDAYLDHRTRDTAALLSSIAARAFINMPVTEHGEFVALLFVNNAEVREWAPEELAFMRELGARTRVAVERRRAEEELQALNASLEERIRQRGAELQEAHDALRQSQKLEAIGQLTGGVAHDFNNLLTVIGGSAELLQRPGLSEDRRRRHIDAISTTVARAAKLTAQLLAFARRQALKPEVFDVGRNILAVGDIVRSLIGSSIRVDTDLPVVPCFVEADPSQFDTAIINMATNARDAMKNGGELRIRVGVADGIPARRAHPEMPGTYVAVEVVDSGEGIAAEYLERIFEPFFSTKGVGQGTGLGLSQVFGFAKQSGGEVLVRSELGEGASFTLYLPMVEAVASAPERSGHDARPLPDGNGRCVLVVEDNPDVLGFATRTLTDLGYRTVQAIDGRAALAELDKDAERFDIVFSDVMMPGMNGIELGQEIRRRFETLPVVLTSGYSHVLAEQGPSGFELLQKPYTMEQLSVILQKVAPGGRRAAG